MPGTKPENGRWPLDFLNRQLENLVLELRGCGNWNQSSLANIREPIESHPTNDNWLDCAQIDMRQFVGTIILEQSAQKIRNIRVALRCIKDDLESHGKHRYGKCAECGEYINPVRLEASPWVQKCAPCQASCEVGIPGERKVLRPELKQIRLDKLYKNKTKTCTK